MLKPWLIFERTIKSVSNCDVPLLVVVKHILKVHPVGLGGERACWSAVTNVSVVLSIFINLCITSRHTFMAMVEHIV